MTCFVDFDDLVYLQLDHAPGYQQWWVMLNLGQANLGDKSSLIIQRFAHRKDAEEFKAAIRHGCTIFKHHAQNEYSGKNDGQ